ncbi:MAG: PAS domain S-box protein [Candidatus Omnitrophica bacterium]|nr:PAS domain S-box protein [Candidatus Omnitrophota bacterium]MBU1869108.1 PAS domain S-box protein [Candidatus Omnitrophota bacterium]
MDKSLIVILFSSIAVLAALIKIFRIERKRRDAEEALKRSESRYRELVENANSIILRMDVNGCITFFNEFAQRYFGYKESEIIGKNVIGTIVPSTDISGRDLKFMIQDIMVHPDNYINNENENLLRDGRWVWIAWTNKAILDKDNSIKEVLSIGNDITALKQAEIEILKAKEAVESASKTKSSFFANMSHELRTPLNSVIGFSEVLGDQLAGVLSQQQKEYLGYIGDNGRHLLALINDILDFSKAEAGKMELELSEFNLKELLEISFGFIKERAMTHGIGLSVEIHEDIGMVKADQRKIKQVMLNLLSNAAKFTPDGGRIGVKAQKSADSEVEVCVWDNGIGVDPKDAQKVFAEFEQIYSELSRKSVGTGLGMPLSKKLIELHGGKMWFESEGKGRGSRFYFTLPLK